MTYTATSYNIKISVTTKFEENFSDADTKNFIFSYEVTIENMGDSAVHLLSRHWEITDALDLNYEVDGEGVVGEKPIILPGESYIYSSWCKLSTDAGKMKGTYTMNVVEENRKIKVTIPEFLLIPNFKLS